GNEGAASESNDTDSTVSKDNTGSGTSASYGQDTSDKAEDATPQQAAGGIDSTGEQAQTLVKELEEIAQRLGEINQDTFGKIHWQKAIIRKARRALVALNNHAIAINRRLINEEAGA